jgi:hypothetical protein
MPDTSNRRVHTVDTAPSGMRWIAYAASLWAFVFGVFHVLWVLGWYVGLNPETARIAFQSPVLMTYDLLVVGACALGTIVTLGMVMPWGQRVSPRLLGGVARIGTALLVLRAGASLVQTGYLLVVGRFTFAVWGIWEPWFFLGALLFGVSTWRFGRRTP